MTCRRVHVVEGKDIAQDTDSEAGQVAGDDVQDFGGDEYPPDEDFEDPTEAMPSSVPRPRAAGIRAAARAQQQAKGVARPTTKAKPAKRVKKGGGSKLLAQQRRRQALELRKAGASYQQIAETLGYHDASGARKAVIKAFGEVIHEPVSELRTMQVERLNHMLMAVWPRVQQGDDTAIRTALGIMDKMDRLQGTEQAPDATTVTNQNNILVIDGSKDDYIAQMRKMAGIDANGHNVGGQNPSQQPQTPALPAAQAPTGDKYPPGMIPAGHGPEHFDGGPDMPDEVVDAELVEDADVVDLPLDQRDTSPAEPVRTGEAALPTKKKFSFSVEPTVRRKKD